jgi:hypothetical protein
MDPILEHHYNNLAENKAVSNEDGSVSTVYTAQVEIDGKPTLIPTVWDGEIISTEEASEKAVSSGVAWPTADTHPELREYDKKLHKDMKPMSQDEALQFLEVFKAGKRDIL